MNPNQQKRYISREFKKRGLSLQPAAIAALINVLRREREYQKQQQLLQPQSRNRGIKRQSSISSNSSNKNDQHDILQILLNEIKERMINDRGDGRYGSASRSCGNGGGSSSSSFVVRNQSIVTQEILQSVVADLSRDGNDVLDEALQLLDAWKMKRLDYNVMKKSWKLVDEIDEGDDVSGGGGNNATGTVDEEKRRGRSIFGQPCDKVREWNTATAT